MPDPKFYFQRLAKPVNPIEIRGQYLDFSDVGVFT
jgi:hypothetical protein